jgi:hypothetical protein
MSIQLGSGNVPRQAFERWLDPDGNPLVSINRDGTLTTTGVRFADGSEQTSASSSGGGVSSWDGRTGAVVPTATDYSSIHGLNLGDGKSSLLFTTTGFGNFSLVNESGSGIAVSSNTTSVTANGNATIQVLGTGFGVNITDNSSNTLGLSGTTAATATAGAASLPVAPVGFLEITINGTEYKLPYYAV